jgi:hypothetical protein
LLSELSRLSNSLAALIAKLTAMAEHVIDCQQRSLLVTNQTQVLLAVDEHFEFLTRHALVDPLTGTRRVVTVRDLARLRRLSEKREAAEELWQFERRFATETGSVGQETETRGEIGCYPPPGGRMDADRAGIEDCNPPCRRDPEEDAADGGTEDLQQDQLHDDSTSPASGISTELLDGRAAPEQRGVSGRWTWEMKFGMQVGRKEMQSLIETPQSKKRIHPNRRAHPMNRKATRP